MFKFKLRFFIFIFLIFYFNLLSQNKYDIDSKIPGTKNILSADQYFGWEGHYWGASQLIFNGNGTILFGSGIDGTIRLWDEQKGDLIKTIPAHGGDIASICISPDGSKIASASGVLDSTAKLWDLKTGNLIRIICEESHGLLSVAFSIDGKIIATGGWEKKVKLWNVEDGKFIKEYIGHTNPISSIAFSSDGRNIISCCEGGKREINIWDLKGDTLIRSIKADFLQNSVFFLPDGKKFISGYQKSSWANDRIILWDAITGSIIKIFTGYTFKLSGTFALSPDGTQIAVACDDFNIRIIDITTGSILKIFYDHKFWISSLAFTSDGEKLASTSLDRTIKLWDVKTASEIKTFQGVTASVTQFIYSPDGKKLASGGTDSRIKLWNASDGSLLTNIKRPEIPPTQASMVISLAFSPDGMKLASTNDEDPAAIYIWNINTGDLIKSITDSLFDVWGLAFSPDGKLIATGCCGSKTIKIVDVNTGKIVKRLKADQWIGPVAFSPDGNILASGEGEPLGEGSIKLWDVNTGNLLAKLSGHQFNVNSLSFSPDGTKLISGGGDGTIRIWDVLKGTLIYLIKGNRNDIEFSSVCFSPDGKNFASASWDGTIKIWDVISGNLSRTIIFDHGYSKSICYSTDGSKIASGGWGYNNMRIYNLNTNSIENGRSKIKDFQLNQNYPNPFNPSTIIQYSIPEKCRVNLKIFNSLGQEIDTLINKEQREGSYMIEWKPQNISEGIYFCRMQAGKYVDTKKVVYLK